jgi:transmembrane sensor
METNLKQDEFELVGKYLSQELILEEQLKFSQWLNQSEYNREEFDRILKNNAYLEANLAIQEVDVDRARLMTDFKIWKNNIRNLQEKEKLNKRFKLKNSYKIAAILIFLLTNAGILIYFYPAKMTGAYTEVLAPFGSRTQLKLPDGTQVWLNAGSVLKYTNHFSKENREVLIEGEAFFDVTHDPSHPFIVHASSINLTVLGTAFNIRAYKDENKIETTLLRGKVEIEKNNPTPGEQKIELHPKEKATFIKSENKLFVNTNELQEEKGDNKKNNSKEPSSENNPSKVRNENSTEEIEKTIAWKEGYLVFDNEPLADIMVTLSRKYDVKFIVTNKETLHYKFTGKFKETTLEQVLKAIMLTSPLEATVKQNQVTIKENEDLKEMYVKRLKN